MPILVSLPRHWVALELHRWPLNGKRSHLYVWVSVPMPGTPLLCVICAHSHRPMLLHNIRLLPQHTILPVWILSGWWRQNKGWMGVPGGEWNMSNASIMLIGMCMFSRRRRHSETWTFSMRCQNEGFMCIYRSYNIVTMWILFESSCSCYFMFH